MEHISLRLIVSLDCVFVMVMVNVLSGEARHFITFFPGASWTDVLWTVKVYLHYVELTKVSSFDTAYSANISKMT